MARRKRPTSTRAAGIAGGWRSGLEEKVSSLLAAKGITFSYERLVVPYLPPAKTRKYTPDFLLPNGIIIETKGRFLSDDRQKHLWVKQQHPTLDIRFVFSNPNAKIGKKSATTYAAWCEKNGFKYAAKVPPESWLTEPLDPIRLASAMALTKE